MVCPECARLLLEYRDAVYHYSQRVTDLVELVALDLGDDMELLRRKAREAWDASERARTALVRHEGNHFCDRADFTPPQSNHEEVPAKHPYERPRWYDVPKEVDLP